jgi:quinolinate synthase
MRHVVEVEEGVRVRAKRAIDAMLALPKLKTPAHFGVGLTRAELEVA